MTEIFNREWRIYLEWCFGGVGCLCNFYDSLCTKKTTVSVHCRFGHWKLQFRMLLGSLSVRLSLPKYTLIMSHPILSNKWAAVNSQEVQFFLFIHTFRERQTKPRKMSNRLMFNKQFVGMNKSIRPSLFKLRK